MNINNPFLNNTQEDDFVFIFSQLNITNKDQNNTKPVKRKSLRGHSLRKSHNAPHERSKRSKQGSLDTQHFDFGQVIQNNAFTQGNTSNLKRKDIHRHSLRKSHNAPHERSKRSKQGALDIQRFDFGQVIQNNTFTQGNTSNPKRKYTENPITKRSQTPCNSPKRRTSEKLTSVAKNRLPNQKQTAYFSPYNINQN